MAEDCERQIGGALSVVRVLVDLVDEQEPEQVRACRLGDRRSNVATSVSTAIFSPPSFRAGNFPGHDVTVAHAVNRA